LYADVKHLGDQNHREKSCYVASEFIQKKIKLLWSAYYYNENKRLSNKKPTKRGGIHVLKKGK
jgi:hypothetical protein